jgi:HTH-type transcriptional regulator / antitoxin HigA
MTLTFNRETYAQLLIEVLPQPIKSEAEYQRVLAIVELLMNKANTSVEEDSLLDLFVILVEKFESEHYPSQNLSTPHSRLLHLMEANNLQQSDLIPVFGSSDLATEIIEGKRSIDRTHADKLSDRFNLPSKLFLV